MTNGRMLQARAEDYPMLNRVFYLVYGVICYAIFLGTFLYAIAFVGGFWVPTRLDGPLRGSPAEALLINVGLLGIFAVQHSVMARRWFKERWTQYVPWAIERSTYVLRKPRAHPPVLAVASDGHRGLDRRRQRG